MHPLILSIPFPLIFSSLPPLYPSLSQTYHTPHTHTWDQRYKYHGCLPTESLAHNWYVDLALPAAGYPESPTTLTEAYPPASFVRP